MFTNNSKQNYLPTGIYPSTLTNVRFGIEDWVLQGKEQLHSNRNCSLGSGIEPFWGFKGQMFLAFNIIKVTKRLTMTLKQLHSWPKKLYQFMTNLFFLTNIPTPGQVQHQVDKNFTSSYFGSWSTSFRERYLPLKYYICKVVHANKVWKNVCIKVHLKVEQA